MITNQMMKVPIGDFGTIFIGHKDKFGRVKDILNISNKIAQIKNIKSKTLNEILRTQEFWKYVIATDNLLKNIEKSVIFNSAVTAELKYISNFKELEKHIDKNNKVKYSKLMNEFPNLIKSKRGKYGGTWMHLNLLLKLAAICDPDLEALIYDTFIKHKILDWRDYSGDSFKELCSLLNRKGLIRSEEDYKDLSRQIKIKVLGERHKGVIDVWNRIATKEQLEQRDKLESYLINIINDDLINSFDNCLNIIDKFKLNRK